MATSFVLDNAAIWTGDGGVIGDGHVEIEGETIRVVSEGRYTGDLPATDLGGASLSPGLIDLMVCGGFNRCLVRDDLVELGRAYLELGVTTFQTCLGCLPYEKWTEGTDRVREAMQYGGTDSALLAGLYPEGMFLVPRLAGGSQGDMAMAATAENLRRVLDDFADVITTINVSPGIDGDEEATRFFAEAGKRVSMAHSDAPAQRVSRCLESGASVVGHVWNNNFGGMIEAGVQRPMIDHVALTDERVEFVHLICDGTHVHPVVVKMVYRCRGLEAICLVTDSNIRAGCSDGPYIHTDGRQFNKINGAGRTETGHLAGSGRLLPDHFRSFIRFTGAAPNEVIRTVTHNPARHLRMDDEIGLVAAGRRADLVAWDRNLLVKHIWRAGRPVEYVSDLAEVRP